MTIEVLFSEDCCLFGDLGNIMYLKKCLPKAKVIYTSLKDEPKFVSSKVNLIYLGPMTESVQERVIKKLKPYKKELVSRIKEGTVCLFTGNAFEVIGSHIETEDGKIIKGLKISNTYSKRDMINRYNGLVLGKLNEIEIVGFKSQFSHTYADNSKNYFLEVVKGIGINKSSKLEGIRINNFFGTYLLGPILPLNPIFTKYILELMGQKKPKLIYEDVMMDAYKLRVEEFKKRA